MRIHNIDSSLPVGYRWAEIQNQNPKRDYNVSQLLTVFSRQELNWLQVEGFVNLWDYFSRADYFPVIPEEVRSVYIKSSKKKVKND